MMNERLGGLPDRIGEGFKRFAYGGMVDDKPSYDWRASMPSPAPPTYNIEPFRFDYGAMAKAVGSGSAHSQQSTVVHAPITSTAQIPRGSNHTTRRGKHELEEALATAVEKGLRSRGIIR